MDSKLDLAFREPQFFNRIIRDEDLCELGKLLNLADKGTVDDPGLSVDSSTNEIRDIKLTRYHGLQESGI